RQPRYVVGSRIRHSRSNLAFRTILDSAGRRFRSGLLLGRPTADPAHHPAKPLSDLLQRMLLGLLPHTQETLTSSLAFADPLASKLAGLDLRQDVLHPLFGGGIDEIGRAHV